MRKAREFGMDKFHISGKRTDRAQHAIARTNPGSAIMPQNHQVSGISISQKWRNLPHERGDRTDPHIKPFPQRNGVTPSRPCFPGSPP